MHYGKKKKAKLSHFPAHCIKDPCSFSQIIILDMIIMSKTWDIVGVRKMWDFAFSLPLDIIKATMC